MPINFVDIFNPLFGGFPPHRPIRRINDGRRVDGATERDLRGLPEHTLRDIGYTSQPG
mgnify:CR=1 FL=1